jgi:hypothetical protein
MMHGQNNIKLHNKEFESLCQRLPYAITANGIKIHAMNFVACHYII